MDHHPLPPENAAPPEPSSQYRAGFSRCSIPPAPPFSAAGGPGRAVLQPIAPDKEGVPSGTCGMKSLERFGARAPWFGVPSAAGTWVRKWLHLFVLLRSGNDARCLLEGSVLTLTAHASHCCQGQLGLMALGTHWPSGLCSVVLGASGLQRGQGDRSLPRKVPVPGTHRDFLTPGNNTSVAPSASHPAQGSSGVQSEPGWGARCWNRAQ